MPQQAAQLQAVGPEYRDPTDVITGIFTAGTRTALVLFDTGASTSFVATSFAIESGLPTITCGQSLTVETPLGRTVVDRMVLEMHLSICGCNFFTQPFVLEMRTFDLILGMD